MYEYTPIADPRTIRLIQLHPGVEPDPIKLSLVTTPLDAAPAFEAISYCWGDARDQHEVTCNGAALSITNSLYTGLVHFRLSDEPRVLWADAICINQADVVEKSEQVVLMASIYSQATRVLIWLGIADDPVYGSIPSNVGASIRQAIPLLPDFNPEDAADIEAKAKTLRQDLQRLRDEGKPNVLDHDWMPLAALLARPWFRRKWVVQEVSLARDAVLCAGGGVEIPWLELAPLAFKVEGMGVERLIRLDQDKTDKQEDETQEGLGGEHRKAKGKKFWSMLDRLSLSLNMVTSMSMVQIYRHHGTLLDGVVATKFFYCTDPRDHVYSLLSLGAQGPSITPDYGALVADVFHQFAITMLLEGQSLKLLSLAPDRCMVPDPSKPRLEGLPSWVPDLRLMRDDVLVSYTVRPQAFFAGGHAKPILSLSEDQRILSCKGRVVDTIKACSTSLVEMIVDDMPEIRYSWDFVSDPILHRKMKRLARWLEGCYQLAFGHSRSSEGFTGSSTESMAAFSRAMVCGIDHMHNRLSPEIISAFPRYMEWAIDCAENKDGEMKQHAATMLKFSTTIDHTVNTFASLKFCVTEHGRFAHAFISSQPGDRICVLQGGEVPFVIRPTGHGTYTLIGECYVDGIMDGKALSEAPGEEVPTELLETIHLE